MTLTESQYPFLGKLASIAEGSEGGLRTIFFYGVLGVIPLALLCLYAYGHDYHLMYLMVNLVWSLYSGVIMAGLWNMKSKTLASRVMLKAVGFFYGMQCLGTFMLGLSISL